MPPVNKIISRWNRLPEREELEVNTLENAIYMNMKNDVSFVFDSYMNLYEHQSTYNPNMPLRNLFYIARLLEKEVQDQTLYSSTIVPIPTPKFIVFYNGSDERPERETLKLSDAFEKKTEEPELELKVLMLNMNPGKNQEILEKCRLLHDYMEYVTRVRTYANEMEIEQAVERTVNQCIEEGILREFLLKYKAEAIQMSIFEYDEEKEMKLIREAEYNEGVRRGIGQGIIEGILELLEELGEIPEALRNTILEQKDEGVLKQWLKLAAKAASVEAFACEIRQRSS